jgi:hypothetical protein
MAKKFIDALVGPNGEIKLEGVGFVGKECDEKMKFLEDALSGDKNVKRKAEWFMQNSEALRRERKMGVDGSDLCG